MSAATRAHESIGSRTSLALRFPVFVGPTAEVMFEGVLYSMPPEATNVAATIFVYQDRISIVAGRWSAEQRRKKGDPRAPLPEHRAAKIAADRQSAITSLPTNFPKLGALATDDSRGARTGGGRAIVAFMADGEIELQDGGEIDLAQLARLRVEAAWEALPEDVLRRQIEGSRWVSSARLGGELIGFVRAISDGVSNAYVCGMLVDVRYRKTGLGRRLLEHLIEPRPTIRWVLHARDEVVGFYEKCGFSAADRMFRRERRSPMIAPT